MLSFMSTAVWRLRREGHTELNDNCALNKLIEECEESDGGLFSNMWRWSWQCQSHSLMRRLSLPVERMLQSTGVNAKGHTKGIATWPSLCHCLIWLISNQHSGQSLLSPEVVSWNFEGKSLKEWGIICGSTETRWYKRDIRMCLRRELSRPHRYRSCHLKATAFTPTELSDSSEMWKEKEKKTLHRKWSWMCTAKG